MNKKVGIIGIGHVGAHCAYALAIQGIVNEIVLIDIDEKKVIGECQDLIDSSMFFPHRVDIHVGEYKDLKDCDILVNSAGQIDLLKKGSRIDEMSFTIKAVRSIADKINESGFDGIFVNITNPCDVVTNELSKLLKLKEGKILGTGTGLDTSRLITCISRETGIDHRSITSYMIGEHGASQIAVWSATHFGGISLEALAKNDDKYKFDRDKLQKEAIGAAWITFSGKFCTEYGIASTCARLVNAIFNDTKSIIPVSAKLNGEYGEKDLFVGVPAIIGKNGVEQVIELPLTEQEKADFKKCCDDLRSYIKMAEDIK